MSAPCRSACLGPVSSMTAKHHLLAPMSQTKDDAKHKLLMSSEWMLLVLPIAVNVLQNAEFSMEQLVQAAHPKSPKNKSVQYKFPMSSSQGVCQVGHSEGAPQRSAPVDRDCIPPVWGGGGNDLGGDKFDVDKFGSPTPNQIFPSILRMRCVKLCAPGMGCRRRLSRNISIYPEAIRK